VFLERGFDHTQRAEARLLFGLHGADEVRLNAVKKRH